MTNYFETNRISGCQFTLYPMSDEFVDIITLALENVDMSKVWQETDDVSTILRGKIIHIFDVTSAIFLQTAKTGKHIAMSGTFSIGCPGDSKTDVHIDETDTPKNKSSIKGVAQKAGCKFSLYPMGINDYMKAIYEQIDLSKQIGVNVTPTHHATRLDGDAKAIFQTLYEAFYNVQTTVRHVNMTFTISANSPSNT